MDINILSESVVIPISTAFGAILTYLFLHINEDTRRENVIVALTAALGLAGLAELIIHLRYPIDKLPMAMWLMILPFMFTLCMSYIFWRGSKEERDFKLLSVLAIIIGLLLTLVIINKYYRFYPTLYSLIGIENRKQALVNQNATFVQFSSTQHAKFDQTSIEASLYSRATEDTKGSIQPISIPGVQSKFKARLGYVYIPKIANSPAKLNLPVIILLPGVPGLPQNTLDGLTVKDTMDEFARLHQGITPYVFMLDDTGAISNDTECVDSPRGHVETYLTKDVPDYIKSHYDVASLPSGWAIGGLSMGGMCGAMLTLRHTDTFRYFLDFGGEGGPEVGAPKTTISALFGGSENSWFNHQIPILLSSHKYKNVGGYFASARNDSVPLVNSIHDNYLAAKNSGVEAIYESINGEHTFNVWQQSYKDSIPWLSNRLGATICSTTCK